jgi:hypothetical protein
MFTFVLYENDKFKDHLKWSETNNNISAASTYLNAYACEQRHVL